MALKLKQRLKAAAAAFREATWYPTATGGSDPDEYLWRRLSANPDRDLSPWAQDMVLQAAYYLYETDPLARRIIQISRDYVVAEGVKFEAKDDRVQQVLERFWNDPINNFDLHFPEEVLELGLWGEQCYPVYVNPVDGFVRKGYLDPARINTVVLDPDNARVVREIKLNDLGAVAGKTLTAVSPDLNAYGQTFGYNTGNCFYFKINGVTTASRGRSDLMALADYLDLYNQFLFTRGERAAFGNAWIWDVLLKNQNEGQIKKFLQENPPPKPGSVRAHNENVEWTCVAPDLKAHDATYDARMIKNYVLGGAGFPEYFFAEGGETNLATATAMADPVIKNLTCRQGQTKSMLRSQVEFVIDQAQIHRTLPMGINREVDLFFPEISSKDLGKVGAVMVQAAQALLIAEERGWVKPEGAARAFCEIASLLGAEVEPSEVIEKEVPPGDTKNPGKLRQAMRVMQ
ncbi:MAG: hypothetical protein ACYC6G_20085 [Desulfobaccales bacterium]